MPFPTTSVIDTFTRANENPLSNGGKWTATIISGDTALQLLSNSVVGLGGTENSDYWNPATYGPDCEAYVDVPTLPGFGAAIGLFSRITTPGASVNAYVATWTNLGGSSAFTIASYVGGVITPLFQQASTLLAGDSIGMSVVSSVITVYRKTSGVWSVIGSVGDSSISGAGNIGIISSDTVATLANFGGGTIGKAVNFPTTSVLDTFVRADENPLSDGGKWTVSDSSHSAMKIVSNKAIASGITGADYWNPTTFGSDSEAYVDVTSLPSASQGVFVGCRAQNAGPASTTLTAYKLSWLNTASSQWQLMSLVNGSGGAIASWTGPLIAGDSIGMSVVGSTITAYRKTGGSWSAIGSFVDTSVVGVGNILFGTGTSSGAAFANFGGGSYVYPLGSGIALLNFGNLPGSSSARTTVTGQTGLLSGSKIEAWLFPPWGTLDHSEDEHVTENIKLSIENIVAGVGFDIVAEVQRNRVIPNALFPSGDRLTGAWQVAYAWS
jgi:hypothetical protein